MPRYSLATFALTFLTSLAVADLPKPIAIGKVVLAKALEGKAKGTRTVFLSLYDSAAKSPMPYGAVKIEIKEDVKELVSAFSLSKETMMIMSPGDVPARFDLKAKLDKDGSAGPDSSGDLIGWARGLQRGAKNVTVTIDQAVP